MKKILLGLLLYSSFRLISQVTFTDSNLPIIVINTGTATIVDAYKITADFGVIYNGPGNRNYLTDPYNYFGKIGIEIRGSTSQQYPKKSYGLETRDILGNNLDTTILGLPPENDWILYGAYPDKTLMRNEITYDLFRRMGHYDARYKFVELVINGQYKGVYSFMEKLKRDKNRINISKLTLADTIGDQLTGGYVIKVDKPTGSSTSTWNSPYNSKVKYLYHDPEDVDLTTTQKNYIKNYVVNFENVTNSPGYNNPVSGYPSLIDVNSFVDFMIMQELGKTVDGYRSSSFMYKDKDSKGGLLKAGPMWDFNLSYGNADYCAAYDTTGYQYKFNMLCGSTFTSNVPFYWEKFTQDTNFCNKLQCRWQYLRKTILKEDSINKRIDDLATILAESQVRNFIQWPILGVYVNWNYYIGATYLDELNYLKKWFRSRSSWLDTNWPGTCYLDVSIGEQNTIPVSWQAFPNPATNYFYIKVNEPFYLSGAELRLCDVNGKEVLKESNINYNEILILKGNLAAGMYFFNLQQNGKLVAKGKIVFTD
ncbi:MAG: CotH kinase family protein [Bacteroidia bacterium]|nr:CotH kinase family protein [Bacteroidia bacterium]